MEELIVFIVVSIMIIIGTLFLIAGFTGIFTGKSDDKIISTKFKEWKQRRINREK